MYYMVFQSETPCFAALDLAGVDDFIVYPISAGSFRWPEICQCQSHMSLQLPIAATKVASNPVKFSGNSKLSGE